MTFGSPEAIALAALALPIGIIALRRRPRPVTVLPLTAGISRRRPTWRLRLARWLPVLRIVAVVLLAAALRPATNGDANAIVPAEGIDIVLSIDSSSSMLASLTATNKTRLETSKDVIREFIKGRENNRIGIVTFARESLALSPPSLDYEALDTILARLETGILPDGTAIGVGIAEAVNMLRQSDANSRVIILLTDGQHNADSIAPLEAGNLAKALRIRVYTIGVIDPGRAGAMDIDEELLMRISEETGGRYFTASTAKDLAAVYTEIGLLETSKIGRERYEKFTELGPYLAAIAAALLAFELLLAGTWLRRNQ